MRNLLFDYYLIRFGILALFLACGAGAATCWASDARFRHAVGTPHGHRSAQREHRKTPASMGAHQRRSRMTWPAAVARTHLRAATDPRAAVQFSPVAPRGAVSDAGRSPGLPVLIVPPSRPLARSVAWPRGSDDPHRLTVAGAAAALAP